MKISWVAAIDYYNVVNLLGKGEGRIICNYGSRRAEGAVQGTARHRT